VKLSVCIPVYDAPPHFLAETLTSIFAQRGPFELEVIVCDDASNVDYSALRCRFPRLRYLRNERNLGMVTNWNHAVRQGSGDLVILIGQDDRLVPDMFAHYVREFSQDPTIALCACARRFIDDRGHEIRPMRAVNDRNRIFRRQSRYRLNAEQVLHLCLRNGNAIGEPSCVMYRRRIFDELRGYDPHFRHAADLDFNLRAARMGDIVYLATPYVQRRLHAARLTHENWRNGHVSRERLEIHRRHASHLPRAHQRRFHAYLLAAAVKDFMKSLRTRHWTLMKRSLAVIGRHVWLPPTVYTSYLLELASGRNRDAM
jgi:GT2 family glycosyltransferase